MYERRLKQLLVYCKTDQIDFLPKSFIYLFIIYL